MRLSHLTDSEIQSCLDNAEATTLFRLQVGKHLAFCKKCSDEVAEYERLRNHLIGNETDVFSDKLSNRIMDSLPNIYGKKPRHFTFNWVSTVLAVALFFGILFIPFEIGLPAFSYPTINWATISNLPVVSSVLQLTKSAISPEHLSLYLFALLAGLIMYNIERILFGFRRQNI